MQDFKFTFPQTIDILIFVFHFKKYIILLTSRTSNKKRTIPEKCNLSGKIANNFNTFNCNSHVHIHNKMHEKTISETFTWQGNY